MLEVQGYSGVGGMKGSGVGAAGGMVVCGVG